MHRIDMLVFFTLLSGVSAVRDLGGREDAAFLRSLLPARTKAEESMVKNALKALEGVR